MKLASKIGASLAALALVSSAHAASIAGTVTFSGNATLNGPFASATGVTSFSNTSVLDGTGDFTGVIGSAVLITAPWTFTSNVAVTPFWSIPNHITPTFSFSLTSSSLVQNTGTFIDVVGNGVMTSTIPGLTPTPGTWTFNISTTNPANSRFSFQSSTSSVPDGGTTLAILGGSLLGLHGLRRKFSRR